MKSRAMALDALRTTRPVRTAVNTPAHINQVFDAIAYQNTAAVGKPVDRVFASFITQSSMPLMTAKMTCASQKTELVLSQRPMSQAVPASTLWDIPVCYKRARDGKLQPAACTLLSGGTQTLRLDGCSSWIFANADRRGYYRTSYDPKNVHALGEAVRNGQLTPLEQTTLLEDLWTLSVFSATSRASPSSSHSRRS
ncbi:MAG TPA: hypothetical protein VM115_07395 [Vicinamibacterales bacterium]|nr:hypothetical protein [Vicinamibacterales bacterium]